MSFRVFHEQEASTEFREAVAWYEAKDRGLGARFVFAVDKTMLRISDDPLRFPKASRKSRQARVLGWPYTIYFALNDLAQEIKIVAIWHGARNPAELRRRLK